MSKTFSKAQFELLQAVCSLEANKNGVLTELPDFYQEMAAEGKSKTAVKRLLAQHLQGGNGALIFVSPELVTDVKNLEFGLGLD